MSLGVTLALTAPIGTSLAQAAPARRATRVPALKAYVTNTGDSTVTPINTVTNTAGTPIPGITLPAGIAITPNGVTAYGTDPFHRTVTPINTATDTLGNPITVTGSTADQPTAIAIAPNGATAYVTSGSNVVWPINLITNSAGPPIPVVGAQDIAIMPNGATAYVTDPSDNTVTPINLATNTAGTPIPVAGLPPSAGGPRAIAITPNGTTAYLASGQSSYQITGPGAVTPINTATNTAGTPIPVGTNPSSIAITPNGSTGYVTSIGCLRPPPPRPSPCSVPDPDGEIVTPIDTATNTAGTPITVGLEPNAIAITPDQAPVAHLSVAPAEAGQPTGFDASASTVAVGTIATYAWDFGDGSMATTSTPTTTHTYATSGTFTATVTETDSAGTSTTPVFTGQTISNNGGPSAVASQSFTVVPRLAISTTSVPAGTVGTRYSATLQASGGNPPYKWSIISGTLPTGLHLRRSTGVLTRKPTTTGTFTFTVQVVDQKTTTKPHTQNTATATFSLTIS